MPRINKKLTEKQIINAKPKDKDYRLYDTDGLTLLVRKKSGTRVWQYRYTFNGKANKYTIGRWPKTGSADAREALIEIKKCLSQGIDPNQHKFSKKLENIEAGANTFKAIAEEWYEKNNWAPKHAKNIKSRMEKDVYALIGAKPIDQITAKDIIYVLQQIENRGALDVAMRICQYCTAVFDYAMNKGICENNPALGRSKFIKSFERKHRRFLKESQLPGFFKALNEYRGTLLVRLAMQLLFLTLVRPGELRGARWDEFDLEKAEWRIPKERMKMKREHLVFLSTQATDVIHQIKSISHDSPLLFPGRSNNFKPISEVTLIKLLKIINYHAHLQPHGVRGTASTILNENGFNRDWIERQLAHVEENKIRAAYHHAEYPKERHDMMQWWGDYLEEKGLITYEKR